MMREYDINLIPDDVLERETLIQRGRVWLFLAGGVLIFLLALNLAIKILNNYSSKEIAALSSGGERVSGEMMQANAILTKEQELLKMRETIGHLSQKGPVITVFTSIDKAINHNIILTHLEIMSQYSYTKKGINQGAGKGGYFSNAAPVMVSGGKDNVVIIRGMSQSNSDLAAMLAELSENEIYTSVNLKYSRSGDTEDGMPVSFEVECMLSNASQAGE